tara:strand:- start:755 stop:1003 length:249 start_codon:yes stop_codon:yes gene_type:complete
MNDLINLYGPMRAVDVLDLLAWEDNRSREEAMKWGWHETDAYFRAWKWLTAVVLDNPRPELPSHAKQAILRVQTKGYQSTVK